MLRSVRTAMAAPAAGVARSRRAKNYNWYFRALERQKEMAEAEVLPPFPVEPLHGRERARAFMVFAAGDGQQQWRVEYELADDLLPVTVDNFLKLCEVPKGEGFLGCKVHRVRRNMGIEFGDYVSGDGTGGKALVGEDGTFEDESMVGRHTVPGTLSMCNHGKDTNNSVVFVSSAPMPHLDGRHVLFGRVTEGLDAIADMAKVFSVRLRPVDTIQVVECGQVRA